MRLFVGWWPYREEAGQADKRFVVHAGSAVIRAATARAWASVAASAARTAIATDTGGASMPSDDGSGTGT
jgi:hypothetical protein